MIEVVSVRDAVEEVKNAKHGLSYYISDENLGRCDILPLSVIATMLDTTTQGDVLRCIDSFLSHRNTHLLYQAMYRFLSVRRWSIQKAVEEAAILYEELYIKYDYTKVWEIDSDPDIYINMAIKCYLRYLHECESGNKRTEDLHYDRQFVWYMLSAIYIASKLTTTSEQLSRQDNVASGDSNYHTLFYDDSLSENISNM